MMSYCQEFLIHNLAKHDLRFFKNFLIDFLNQKGQYFKINRALAQRFFEFLCEAASYETSNSQPFSAWLKTQAEIFVEEVRTNAS